MTPPSVLLVTKGLDIGGIERVVVDLARGLSRRGGPVEVAVVNDARAGLRGLLEEARIPVRALGGSDRIGPLAARRLLQLVRQPRFELVHVHGPLPTLLARTSDRPVVTTAHTMFGALHPVVRAGWRVTAGRDAATVAVSAPVAASLPRAKQVRVIPHGVDPQAVAAARAARRHPVGPSGAISLVNVASHRHVKNHPVLLRAVRLALDAGADVRLRSVGAGPALEQHRALARSLGLDGVVRFEAPTPDGLAAIAGADLLVVSSDVEGQPLVVCEALALGVPVVATAVGRVPDLVSHEVGRVVAPGDTSALAAAIVELATDGALRTRLARAAAAVGTRWTLDDVVDAHLALYEEVRNAE